MKVLALLVALALAPVALNADDHIVDVDRQFDFATLKTFSFSKTSVDIDRPEFRNPLVQGQITDSIRAILIGSGLKEATDSADLIVEWTVSGQAYAVGPFGRANEIQPGRGGRGRAGGSEPEAFIEGTLVVDMTAHSSGLLIWRGVYRDTEKDSSKLAQKLVGDAKQLLAGYPPSPLIPSPVRKK